MKAIPFGGRDSAPGFNKLGGGRPFLKEESSI
jgi:hypothetical protein